VQACELSVGNDLKSISSAVCRYLSLSTRLRLSSHTHTLSCQH
jgi:hypothetical protein